MGVLSYFVRLPSLGIREQAGVPETDCCRFRPAVGRQLVKSMESRWSCIENASKQSMDDTKSSRTTIFAFDSTLPYFTPSLVTSGREGGVELPFLFFFFMSI